MELRDRRGARLRRAARSRAVVPLGLTSLYGLAAVLSAWPGLLRFRSDYLAGGADGHGEIAVGDHGQVVYRFWLFGHRLAAGEAPWRDPYSFQPLLEPQLVLGAWPFGIPFWPLEAGFGPVVAWNVLLLATVVIAGLLTYAWLRSLGLGAIPAAVGGLAFAIAPYRLSQSSEHLLGWIAAFLPLALLAIERSRAASCLGRAHAWGALSALAVVTFPLSGQLHLALGVIPLCLVYAVLRSGRIPLWWTAAGAAVSAGIGLALRLTVIEGSALGLNRTLEAVASYSADAIDFLNRWHPSPSEELVYLGWLTPVLAGAGAVLLFRRQRGLAVVLGLAALLPILLALGTNLPLYAPLRAIVPPLQNVRVPGRFMPIADLALAALAAFGVAWVLARAGPRRAAAVGAALFALVLADLTIMPFAATTGDRENAAYAALRADSPGGRVLELPLFEPGRNEGAVYNLYTLQAPRERPGGYSTLAPWTAFDFYYRLGRLSCGVWLEDDEEDLERLGIDRIVFHRGLYVERVPGAWFAWRELQDRGWRETARDGAVSLLERRPGPRTASGLAPVRVPQFCRGWSSERRTVEPQAPFWVWGEGDLTMEFTAPRPTTGILWVDGRRERDFGIDRRGTIRVRLEGRRWHPVVVEVPALWDAGEPFGLRMVELGVPPP